MAKVYQFMADGFEDIEALAPVDILRRGGLEVVTVSIMGHELVTSTNGVCVKADVLFEMLALMMPTCCYCPADCLGLPTLKNIRSWPMCLDNRPKLGE